jgi:hypothetical protein
MRPLELFHLVFLEKLSGVCVLQSFVYAKGADIKKPL